LLFLAALQLLTVIPFSWQRRTDPEGWGGSTAYFPLVGLVIGLILAGLNWLFSLILPQSIVNTFLIAFLAGISGARHLNGFIHSCDGLASHKTIEERQRVVQDTRVGAFGITGVVLLFLVKYIALSNLPGLIFMPLLVFMPVVSRWAMVYAIFTGVHAPPSAPGAVLKRGTTWKRFTIATVITFAIALVFIPLFQLTGLVILFGVWLITVVMMLIIKNRFAGLSNAHYGAVNEVAEVSAIIIAIVLAEMGFA